MDAERIRPEYRNFLLTVRQEDALLLACARQRFTPLHIELVETICRRRRIEWRTLYERAAAHGVAPLVYANLRACHSVRDQIPTATANAFRSCLATTVASKQAAASKLERYVEYCDAQAIEVMLIKGAVYDRTVYRSPWYTMSSDVDVMLREDQAQYTDEQHRQMGRLSSGPPGLEIECGEHHDISMTGVLPIRFDLLWQRAVSHRIGSRHVLVTSPEETLMTACINVCRRRFQRLKGLCDVASIISAGEAMDWRHCATVIREHGCQNVAYAAITASDALLDCALPQVLIEDLKVSRLRRSVISGLLRSRFRSGAPLPTDSRWLAARIGSSLVLPYSTYTLPMLCRKAKSIVARNIPSLRRRHTWQ